MCEYNVLRPVVFVGSSQHKKNTSSQSLFFHWYNFIVLFPFLTLDTFPLTFVLRLSVMDLVIHVLPPFLTPDSFIFRNSYHFLLSVLNKPTTVFRNDSWRRDISIGLPSSTHPVSRLQKVYSYACTYPLSLYGRLYGKSYLYLYPPRSNDVFYKHHTVLAKCDNHKPILFPIRTVWFCCPTFWYSLPKCSCISVPFKPRLLPSFLVWSLSACSLWV